MKILDRNTDFVEINTCIRNYSEQYLNSNSNKTYQPSTVKGDTFISHSSPNDNVQVGEIDKVPDTPNCPVCDLVCDKNSKAIACDSCDMWIHYLSESDILLHEQNSSSQYICHSCSNLQNNVQCQDNSQYSKTVENTSITKLSKSVPSNEITIANMHKCTQSNLVQDESDKSKNQHDNITRIHDLGQGHTSPKRTSVVDQEILYLKDCLSKQ